MSGPTSEQAAPRLVLSQGPDARQWRIRPMAYEPPITDGAAVRPQFPDVSVVEDVATDPTLPAHARRVLRLVLEVLEDRRSIDQLAPLLSTPARYYLRALTAGHRAATTRTAAARVMSVRVTQPSTRAAEVAARVRINGRDRALAARFEHTPHGWSCTTMRLL